MAQDAHMSGLHKRQTQFTDSFSREVFEQTYRYANEKDINDRHFAIARDIASVEKAADQERWIGRFLDLLEDFKFVPGGRITSNAGTGLQGTTYINCFVSGFRGENQDSMESIMDELKRQALILKSEGGYGFCVDVLRPRGSFVSGIGGDSPGAVKLLEMWDTQSAVITAGSGLKKDSARGKMKIRKGAQMVTMSVFHPDIEEFIAAKQVAGKLTKFNMSVLVSDLFMQAVARHQPWHLEFPDFEKARNEYRKYWNGNLAQWKGQGLPVKVFKTFEDAGRLWDLIMKATYTRNEPGVLFYDTINRLNNLSYCEHINATNPCGEQVLPVGGCCLLGSLNLTQFVDVTSSNWNFTKLKETVATAVRFLDNVNDKTKVPLSEQAESIKDKRRIGLGVLGFGSALMMMRVRYGSEKALALADALGEFIKNEAYQASVELAREKGSFPLYDRDMYLAGAFIKSLRPETQELIRQYGIRNSHLLSIQPTGNSSVLANNVSGGLEPVFLAEYVRTVVQPFAPEGLIVPQDIDWNHKEFEKNNETSIWSWTKEGDENVLVASFAGEVWKIDQSRGLLKESPVRDLAVRTLIARGQWDAHAPWAATTAHLKIDEHIKTMAVFSRHVDSAISKTVNVPENYPFDDFKRLYLEVYKTGTIKGCTSYREGTMSNVLAAESSVPEQNRGVKRTRATPRPIALECDIHQIISGGEKWVVLVGLLDRDPYEVFAMKQSRIIVPEELKVGRLLKVKSGVYDLQTADGRTFSDICNLFESSEQEALTRLISTALRHGADIEFIVSQLAKSEGNITSFSKAIARTLKKYVADGAQLKKCSDCHGGNLKLQEGCYVCMDCGSSRCE